MQPKTGKSSEQRLNMIQEGLLKGDRVALGQAITLAESTLQTDRLLAEQLIESILPVTGKSIRLGITGAPGVGKSTFIEIFGKHLTSSGKKIAVLSVDPSSPRTKGSILGDKTRMEELSRDPHAFIRPSPSGSSLGGVTPGTREAILLCEATGFDVILVETVGVGQSEVEVRSMVDFFLLLMLPGSGDELQGIKKGIMEMADGIAITKADGERLKQASQAQADFKHALHLFQPSLSGWSPKVITTSALDKTGIHETWELIDSFFTHANSSGYLLKQRKEQQVEWFRGCLDALIREHILGNSRDAIAAAEKKVLEQKELPTKAAREVITKIKEKED